MYTTFGVDPEGVNIQLLFSLLLPSGSPWLPLLVFVFVGWGARGGEGATSGEVRQVVASVALWLYHVGWRLNGLFRN